MWKLLKVVVPSVAGVPVNLQPVKRPDADLPHMLPFGEEFMRVSLAHKPALQMFCAPAACLGPLAVSHLSPLSAQVLDHTVWDK